MEKMKKKLKANEEGKGAKVLIATAAAFIVVVAFCGIAAADPYIGGLPLTTVTEGTVSGGLWFDHSCPMVEEWTEDFTLPSYTDVDWAHLYVAVYCGNMQKNYAGRVNITFNGVQLGGTPDGLSSEEFDVCYTFPGETYSTPCVRGASGYNVAPGPGTGPEWVNDHCVRVTSDYFMWYDVTDLVQPNSNVSVKAWKREGYTGTFDGRVTVGTLVVAYNDGDLDTVHYWINRGHDVDYYYSEYIGETNFTAALPSGTIIQNANLSVVHKASTDGSYTFNEVGIPTDPDSTTTPPGENWQGAYSGYNTWYASSLFNSNSNNTLTYDHIGQYYKIMLAFLTADYAEEGWYWKDYNGEEEGGYMPDFDQNQDFTGDPAIEQNYCAPTAEANSLWWFAQKYPDREVVPVGMTPQALIQLLAWLMDTNGQRTGNLHAGTYVDDEQAGIDEYLIQHGLTDLLYEHTEPKPEFEWIEAEIERCQDVKLDLGFYEVIDAIEKEPGHWQIYWVRIGGHAVTAAGVNSENFMIAISDPDADNAEFGLPGVVRGPNHNHGGVPFRDPAYDHTQHNDGVSASHDIYNVAPSISPGGKWELTDAYWRNATVAHWYYENNGGSWENVTYYHGDTPPVPGEIHTEIEYAVVVSPKCIPAIEVNKTVWDPVNETWVKEVTANVDDTVRFRLWAHNNGTCCNLTNITVIDTLSDSLNYSDNATVNGMSQEPVKTGPSEYVWNFPGPLAPCQNITIEFDARVVECGSDTNVVNATGWCNETMVSDEDSANVTAPCAGVCGDVDGLPGVTTNDGRQIFMYLLYGPGQYPLADLWAADCDGLCDGITTNDGRQIFMNLLYGSGQYPLICC